MASCHGLVSNIKLACWVTFLVFWVITCLVLGCVGIRPNQFIFTGSISSMLQSSVSTTWFLAWSHIRLACSYSALFAILEQTCCTKKSMSMHVDWKTKFSDHNVGLLFEVNSILHLIQKCVPQYTLHFHSCDILVCLFTFLKWFLHLLKQRI